MSHYCGRNIESSILLPSVVPQIMARIGEAKAFLGPNWGATEGMPFQPCGSFLRCRAQTEVIL
jgi:hypothetical protein